MGLVGMMWEVSSNATAHTAFVHERSRSTYQARGGTRDTSLVLDGLLIPTYQADAGQANATMCFGPNPSRAADQDFLALHQRASRHSVALREASSLPSLDITGENEMKIPDVKGSAVECLVIECFF